MSVILVGPMGAGKSTIGKALSCHLGFGFVDLDKAIVAKMGMAIPEIFSRLGEDVFRKNEAECFEHSIKTRQVLATGGGVVLRESNRELLRNHPPVIWLDASPEVLATRIVGDTNRPLIADVDPLTKARELDAVRRPLYAECADLHVSTDKLDIDQAVDCILTYLSESGRHE